MTDPTRPAPDAESVRPLGPGEGPDSESVRPPDESTEAESVRPFGPGEGPDAESVRPLAPGEAPPPPPAKTERRDGPPYVVPWGLADVAATIVLWFLITFVLGGTLVVVGRQYLDTIYVDALTVPFGPLSMVLAAVVWLRLRDPRWVRLLFGMRRPTARDFGIGVLAGIAMFVVLIVGVGNLLQAIINSSGGEAPPVQEALQDLVRDPRTSWILLLSTVFIAPLGEEILFRGLLFPGLRRYMGAWPAIGLSALLFGMVHFEPNPAGYLLVLLILFPAGMVLARLYEWRATLWVPIVAHSVFNLIQVAIAQLSESV